MTNPFENDKANYVVLTNDEGQHSLWPETIDVPEGWTVRHGPASRTECLAHVEAKWTDMRPNSLVALMQKDRPDGPH